MSVLRAGNVGTSNSYGSVQQNSLKTFRLNPHHGQKCMKLENMFKIGSHVGYIIRQEKLFGF